MLRSLRQKDFLIIDAMDECYFDSPWPSASIFLDNLLEAIRQTGGAVVISTRPGPAFDSAIRSGQSIFMAKEILLLDIMPYSQQEYQRVRLPDHERDEVLEFIHCNSEGSFRWIELLLHFLRQSILAVDLRTKMRTLPPTLHGLYRQSLLNGTRLFDRAQLNCRQSLFLVVIHAQRTLRVTAIADTMSLRPDRADIIISTLCKALASTYLRWLFSLVASIRSRVL